MFTIYVLECEEGKYYVGKTDRPLRNRIVEHFEQYGSEWTYIFRPLRVVESFSSTNPLKEDEVTKKYMMMYGIDNVRGGSYTAPDLPDYKIQALEDEICSAENRCFRCMRPGHFANECDANQGVFNAPIIPRKNICFRCLRPGHYANQCFARTMVDGAPIYDY